MNKPADVTKMMQDMMNVFPFDNAAMQDAIKSQAALGEKMTRVALDAAEKSTDITAKWTRETITRLGEMTRVKADPADYSKAATDFATQAAELAAENMAAFAEIAKKVQMETVEIMLAAGKDLSEDATAAMKKATAEVTGVAKKAAGK
ncbi:MAG: Phasin [Alphaproteobacteria bacterium]|nr:Phasin [Alphaproteobacteria bacterium]